MADAGSNTIEPPRPAEVRLAPHDVWIHDVTLISPERSAPVPGAHVVVRGGSIRYVGTSAPGGSPEGVTDVNGTRRFLVPGLIDAHVHLGMAAGMGPGSPGALAEEYFRQLPRSYLFYGFTTVVDLDGADPERLGQLRNAPLGPTVLDCGGAVPLANGYPMPYVPEGLRFLAFSNFLYDPARARAIPAQYRPEDHTPEAAVDRVRSRGGVCVKSYYEPGFGAQSGKLPVPSLDAIRALREAARTHRLPLLLHANSLRAHRFAVAAGVDGVAHGLWNWGDVGDRSSSELPAPVREVLDAERAAGIAYIPTSRVLDGLGELFDPDFLRDPRLKAVVPPGLLEWYRSREGQWYARELRAEWEGQPEAAIREYFTGDSKRGRSLQYAAEQGNRILFGSDTPSAPTYANPPGFNGFLELCSMERYGMPPDAILRSATLDSARFFHLEDRLGSIRPGRVAHLLLLRDDPMRSIRAFGTIDIVFAGGSPIARADLAADRSATSS
jgi:imidazolonepropionase-like amidohydrolase